MDFNQKYNQLIHTVYEDITNDYPQCNDFEKIIILLRKNN